ncbi:hypothetical protein SERLA73DRAFT_121599 [Serpula lacrymans var. lacrymans S7.3]|uniref:Uncharacterized protein n=2 Tax=Serpula lacrymans var. lacrymans TaxID=341189 RepID=F8PSF2_SERL3|nr:uncharacterized protein SERLADRAFT_368436 [Serpula lacrymans var. lacrymans S7.9]EGO01282.1 hypothetical protein SERLA73DRAFT_121599 [Serpula lacrymans var. lacrymans S7.3]EGO26921.1 hypothetical protein SERLADRAFT_368436 [Serpula lacrymans var. lacrymans S7.9]
MWRSMWVWNSMVLVDVCAEKVQRRLAYMQFCGVEASEEGRFDWRFILGVRPA